MKSVIDARAFNRMIDATRSFVAKSDSKTMHQYIRLEFGMYSVTAIAVDGYRMSIEHCVCDSDSDFTAYVKPVKLPVGKSAVFELNGQDLLIRCGGNIFGFQQPTGEFLDWNKALENSIPGDPLYKIGFNGEYLLSALQAAKFSVGGSFKSPVILELRNPMTPLTLRTNKEDIKIVLPVRLKD